MNNEPQPQRSDMIPKVSDPMPPATDDKQQEWTPETVIEIIVDAFESGGEDKATELISKRHNDALAAERETSRYWKEQWVERGAQLAAERGEKHKDSWDKATQEHYEQLEAEFGRLDLRFKKLVALLLEIRELMPNATMKDLKDKIDDLAKVKEGK